MARRQGSARSSEREGLVPVRRIPVWRGQRSRRVQVATALVDDEDYAFLTQWDWSLHTAGYVECRRPGPRVLMQRVIARRWLGDKDMIVRHIDGCKTNNT